MLGVNQLDFMSYMSALKSNYRKGVHRMEAILANPTHAAEFAANLGGVSVVLGVPVDLPDRNSDKLLELLLGSDVADDAVETWLHQFYEFTDWDDLLSDSARCKEMANNPLIWRAAGGSKLAVGKSVATLAGLSCADYADLDAVAASSTAMAAVAASSTAMAAIVAAPVAMAALWRSDTAIKALQANATAWKTFTGASSSVMGKTVAILADLAPSDYADMTAIAASSTAMAAVAASSTAMTAVAASSTAMAVVAASSTAMTAVAASSTAMAAIIANATALNAVVTSSTAMTAVAASSTAMAAIQKSQTALNAIAASSMATAKYAAGAAGLNPADYADMKAVAASSTAMTAVAASSTAMTAIANAWNVTESAIAGSTVALNALKNSGKCQNVTKDIKGAVTASFVSGLCFVFTAEITVSGGRCYIKAARPTGSNELTLCDAVKSVTVNKFCKNPYVQCTDSSHTYEKNKLYFYKIG